MNLSSNLTPRSTPQTPAKSEGPTTPSPSEELTVPPVTSLAIKAPHFATIPQARLLLFEPSNPYLVVFRFGKNDLFGLPGGGRKAHESLEACAIRENAEETSIQGHSPVCLFTTIVHARKETWVRKEAWASWGNSLSEMQSQGEKVRIFPLQTAVFAAKLSGPFEPHEKDGHPVKLLDVRKQTDMALIRPSLIAVMKAWRLQLENQLPWPDVINF